MEKELIEALRELVRAVDERFQHPDRYGVISGVASALQSAREVLAKTKQLCP